MDLGSAIEFKWTRLRCFNALKDVDQWLDEKCCVNPLGSCKVKSFGIQPRGYVPLCGTPHA